MCGIFGVFSNNSSSAGKQVLEGLSRLDYRGYDSWGVAVYLPGKKSGSGKLMVEKDVGEVPTGNNLPSFPQSDTAIGHTRWATHGAVTKNNAHPHLATDGSFALAQNGIVENFRELKEDLARKGYAFTTETDTEVIVHLIEQKLQEQGSGSQRNLLEAVRAAFLDLEGRNTIIVLSTNGDIFAARNGSPLVIGVSELPDKLQQLVTDEVYFSSDTLSFAGLASHSIVLNNGELAVLQNRELRVLNIVTAEPVTFTVEPLELAARTATKEGFDHYMLKEIYESPSVLEAVISTEKLQIEKLAEAIKKAKNVYTIASGTAGLAASQISYYLRYYGGVKATSLIGAEAGSYFELFERGDLLIAPSQSGETADVLEVLELAKEKGVQLVTYVNMAGSTMTRMADFPFMTKAGPEICVMSTKVLVAQLAWGYLLGKTVSGQYEEGVLQLKKLKTAIAVYLEDEKSHKRLREIAQQLLHKPSIFLLGKGQNLAIVQEGMVKIIEGTYQHAHGIPAGDLKHYAITIVEDDVPVIVVLSNDETVNDVLNAAHEVRARGAAVIAITPGELDGQPASEILDFAERIELADLGETSAILNVLPLQLLAYYMTVALGHNVDKPRNIAKSVTVK